MIGTAFREYLISQPGVSGLIGDRVYVSMLKQGATLPAIVMHDSISGTSYEHLTGGDGLASRRVQIDCVASTVDEAEQLREEVRKASATARGTWGSTVSVEVLGCNTAALYAGIDDAKDGSERPRYRRIIDFTIDYREQAVNHNGE
jgi:hypothetical protein